MMNNFIEKVEKLASFIIGIVVLLVIFFVIMIELFKFIYPKYTIAYVDKCKRGTTYYHYTINGIVYDRTTKGCVKENRYYTKVFKYCPSFGDGFYGCIPKCIQNVPYEGWDYLPTYEFNNNIYDNKGKLLLEKGGECVYIY